MPRRIETSRDFLRDQKRILHSPYREAIAKGLAEAVAFLITDRTLPPKYCDHALKGKMKHLRDCHIRPDLLLLYEKPDAETLLLERLGSHSELFG